MYGNLMRSKERVANAEIFCQFLISLKTEIGREKYPSG